MKLALVIFASVISIAEPFAANATPLGSWTINYTNQAPQNQDGKSIAPNNAQVRLTAQFGGASTALDQTLNISGLTQQQATNNMLSMVDNADAKLNGDNSINIRTGKTGVGITKIDGGSNSPAVNISLDGNVDTQNVKPGEKWVALFEPGIDGSTSVIDGGEVTLVLSDALNEKLTFSFNLSMGADAQGAAGSLFDTLKASFTDASTFADGQGGYGVSFYYDSSPGSPIQSIDSFAFSGTGLDFGIVLPKEIPEPGSLPLMLIGLISLFLLARAGSGSHSLVNFNSLTSNCRPL